MRSEEKEENWEGEENENKGSNKLLKWNPFQQDPMKNFHCCGSKPTFTKQMNKIRQLNMFQSFTVTKRKMARNTKRNQQNQLLGMYTSKAKNSVALKCVQANLSHETDCPRIPREIKWHLGNMLPLELALNNTQIQLHSCSFLPNKRGGLNYGNEPAKEVPLPDPYKKGRDLFDPCDSLKAPSAVLS